VYDFDEKFLAKRAELEAAGAKLWPNGFEVTHTSTQLHAAFVGVEDPATVEGFAKVSVGGRVLFRNRMGKAMFLRLQDRGEPTVSDVDAEGAPVQRGGALQVYFRRDDVGEEAFELLKRLDIGDFVWAQGSMMRTRTGELSLHASDVQLASKVLTPFPDRWNSVTDVQTRARQRYVDLFMNGDTREVFRRRSRIVRAIRDFFHEREFLEVETPMMQAIPGGAAARPFVTHHNALDLDLYLRIAPELYLKRLVVGGFERVFELNRNFRNEGVSLKHNPEFTMLEFYQAWSTYEDLMTLTEELVTGLVAQVHDTTVVPFDGRDIDYARPWRRATMDALIAEATDIPLADLLDADAIEAWYRASHPTAGDKLPKTVGKWWEHLFDEYVEHTLVNPTFVTGFPAEISPLARRSDADPFRTDRFELIVNGWEIANAFSELNDPVDQAERFAEQARARTAGDEESMYFDADYIRALSYAMPPTAGEGIGIDRLVMLLTGRTSIREVILFPALRPEEGRANVSSEAIEGASE